MKDTVRGAARKAKPLDGTDAQALEGALQQAERELADLQKYFQKSQQCVRVRGTIYTDVELGRDEVKRIVIETITRLTDVPKDGYIEENQLSYEDEISAGSHSYFKTIRIRQATEFDWAIVKLLNMIKKE